MAQQGFSSQAFVMDLGKKLDPEGDSRTLIDDDSCVLYDKLYELAAREMAPDRARRQTEGLIEAVCFITLRYHNKNFDINDLMTGLNLKLKARDLFMIAASFHEETTSYDKDKSKLLSCLKEVAELLYKLVDEEFRRAKKLDDILAFLTTSSILDKLFMPSGAHHDILSSMAEVFDKWSDGEIFSVM